MRRYLVAGGAGFIGSHLVKRLVAENGSVTVIDNLSTGNRSNLESVSDKIKFIESDITDLQEHDDFDAIFHLACVANPSDYVRRPLEILKSGSFGTDNLLKVAEKTGARFYYFSSSEVYGHHKPEDGIFSESTTTNIEILHDRSPYCVSKIFSEEYVKSYSEMNGVNYLIVRPFNIYGTNMDSKSEYGRVIHNFVNRAVWSEPLIVNGDGSQIRSFCHVSDIVDAMMLLDEQQDLKQRIVNIGNPEPISILDLAKLTIALAKSKSSIEFGEKVDHEPYFRCPNISTIEKWLSWHPRIDLKTGILALIDFEREKNL